MSRIYFAFSPVIDLVKIGRANNVAKRLTAIRTGCPYRLNLISVSPGGAVEEARLHGAFRKWCKGGEWFLAVRGVLEAAEALNDHDMLAEELARLPINRRRYMEIDMSKTTPLERAVDKAGGQSAFARLHGVSQPTVWAWVRQGKPLPAEYVLATERELGISRHDLRPDLYPRESAA